MLYFYSLRITEVNTVKERFGKEWLISWKVESEKCVTSNDIILCNFLFKRHFVRLNLQFKRQTLRYVISERITTQPDYYRYDHSVSGKLWHFISEWFSSIFCHFVHLDGLWKWIFSRRYPRFKMAPFNFMN